MTSSFTLDITEWEEFGERVESLREEVPRIQVEVLSDLGESIVDRLQEIVVKGENIWTGTYLQSINSAIFDQNGQPNLVVGLFPSGPQADRLPIYWKVLEGGASSNPSIPKDALIAWSVAKFGSPLIGLAVIKRNRTGDGGIMANPIISRLFVLDGQFNPIGMN